MMYNFGIDLTEVVFVRFPHCKVTLLLPFSLLHSLEGTLSTQCTLENWGVMLSPFLSMKYLHTYSEFFLMGNLALLPYLLIYSVQIFVLKLGLPFNINRFFFVLLLELKNFSVVFLTFMTILFNFLSFYSIFWNILAF